MKEKVNSIKYLQIAGGVLIITGIIFLSFSQTKGIGYGLLVTGFVPLLIFLRKNRS